MDLIKEKLWLGPVIYLGGTVRSAPTHTAEDLGSNPGHGEKFSLKLTTQDLPDIWSGKPNFH